MHSNEKIICPFCHEPSIAKARTKLDGFKPVGTVLVCMLCNAELAAAEDSSGENTAAPESRKLQDLGVLLGAAPAARARLAAADDEKRFCKDCVHFLKHPFTDRCELDNHPVEAMDDCGKFRKRDQ